MRGDEKLVIAGSDILGRQLRGIVRREASADRQALSAPSLMFLHASSLATSI
jgi:hypothetical protein